MGPSTGAPVAGRTTQFTIQREAALFNEQRAFEPGFRFRRADPHILLPFLILLFAASGCAAVSIYEIVWFQMLGMVMATSAISLAACSGTFMGGMCLGCIALPRLISESRHPSVLPAIELAIGVIGLAVLWGILPLVGSNLRRCGTRRILWNRVACSFSVIFLLPPTVLMGATLPAIARWIKSTPRRSLYLWARLFIAATLPRPLWVLFLTTGFILHNLLR